MLRLDDPVSPPVLNLEASSQTNHWISQNKLHRGWSSVATFPMSKEIFPHTEVPSRSRQETYTICTLAPLRELKQATKIPKGHIRRNSPLVFLGKQVYWIYSVFENNAHTMPNHRKALWPWMHHEEGIPDLTLGQLKPQLGPIKQQRRGASLPRWKQADAIGFTALQQRKTSTRSPAILPTLPIATWVW